VLLILLGGTALAQTNDTNPYTGQPLSIEKLARELESEKAQTAVMEEQLKQGQLRMQLNVLPVRERSEVRQLEQQATKAETPERALASSKAKEAPVKPAAPLPPPAPKVSLSGVIRSGSESVAVLDVNGNSLAVHSAERTPFGTVTMVDDRRIRLGDQELAVRDFALSRMTVSDPKPVAEKPGGAGEQPATNMLGNARFALPPPMPAPAAVKRD
jgi:hypothetical protein